MRDPKRIQRILGLLEELWEIVPDWRFGQLVSNIHNRTPHPDDVSALFYLEDNRWELALRVVLDEYKEKDRGRDTNTGT